MDATVLEVGIGGLYDSTNLVPRPIVTGVSSLGLDHQIVLGNTIQEIARNKAGIYKPAVPALSVKQEEAGEVLQEVAESVGAPFEIVPPIPDTPLGLRGSHQRINASLAVGLAKHFLARRGTKLEGDLPESFRQPLAETKWPGRCQRVEQGETAWLLDGAHTTESLRSCGEWAWSEGRPNILIFNCSGGRAGEALLGSLLEAGAKKLNASVEELGRTFTQVIFCTNVTYMDGHFKGGKSWLLGLSCQTNGIPDLTAVALDPNDLAQLATQNALKDAWLRVNPSFDAASVHVVPSIEHAVKIVRAAGRSETLVAGSLHLVGGVMEVAGLQDALSMA